jgi:3-dehydroquinate synthase
MMMAGYMSKLLGHISEADLDRMADIISRARLPLYPPPQIKPAQFLDMMSVDKKADAGHIRLVLLKDIGTAYMTGDYDTSALDRTLHEWQAYSGERN